MKTILKNYSNSHFIVSRLKYKLCILSSLETYKFVTKWGKFGALDGEFNLPTDVAIDHNDDVFVADSWNHRIQKFSKRVPSKQNGVKLVREMAISIILGQLLQI